MRLHNIASEAAGWSSIPTSFRPEKQSHRRLPAHKVEQLVGAYEAGGTVLALAQQFGVHRTTVSAILKRESVKMRPKGLAPSQVEHAVDLYVAGSSVADIGEALGVAGSTVWRALERRKGAPS